MREHPKDIGDRSQLAIILALKQVGYGVLLPIGENTRSDLAIEDGGSLYLVQCKTGHLKKGAQLQKVRWARDYEIGTVAIGGLRAPSGA